MEVVDTLRGASREEVNYKAKVMLDKDSSLIVEDPTCDSAGNWRVVVKRCISCNGNGNGKPKEVVPFEVNSALREVLKALEGQQLQVKFNILKEAKQAIIHELTAQAKEHLNKADEIEQILKDNA